MSEERGPRRLGVVVLPVPKMNTAALKFLILAMNQEQDLFQFEFYSFDLGDHLLLRLLNTDKTVVRNEVRECTSDFIVEVRKKIKRINDAMRLSEEPPERFVVVSRCFFDDNYYSVRGNGVSVLGLGNWKRQMAPPSFVEFVQVLLVREAVAALCPSLSGSVHLGTKGCVADFTQNLEDARQKVLRGFVCHYCQARMDDDGHPALADTVVHLLQREWLGQPTDPRSPAGVMASLKYDLFTAKGLRETPREAFFGALRQEGAKQIVAAIGGLAVLLIVFFLGLKTGTG
ncbi:MAG TPA: hypothetical protein VGN81_08270 [Pseudonocardiaceae bacterium]|jgi:hypothetical protein